MNDLYLIGNSAGKVPFGGYNHTDMPRLGEWYDMENLSDAYAPLIAPRKSRKSKCLLEGEVRHILYKNGCYYYSAADGIYCHAPEGNNPFSDDAAVKTVKILASTAQYSFLELGEQILCVDESERCHHIALEGGEAVDLGSNARVHYLSHAHFAQGQTKEAVAYLNRHNALYRSMSEDIVKPLTQAGNKFYDAAAEELLNVSFTYEVERDDGTRYIFGDQKHKYSPTAASFAESRYFLGTDNKFYYYHQPSASAYEIAAPNIAIFLHKGVQQTGADYPEIRAGDYINFSLGYAMNYNHVSQDYHIYPTREKALLENMMLRVNRTVRCDAQTGAGWYEQGWEYCIVVDYHAELIAELMRLDLFANSTSYKELCDYTITDPHADAGRQQIYPRYVKIENPFPELSACLEHNNRVWGADKRSNALKASALGNFNNWEDFRGLVSDSYAVSVGSDGAFTASCVLDDALYFFKENSYTVLYGNRPANFCTNTVSDFTGIRAADAASLQVIGGSAYYLGADGRFYRFSGTGAQCISAALGEEEQEVLSSARSAEKYYVLVRNGTKKRLFLYNVSSGLWFAEDAADITKIDNIRNLPVAFLPLDRQAVDSEGQVSTAHMTQVLLLENRGAEEQNRVQWFCESGLLGLESEANRVFQKMQITFESESGARLEVLAQYDNDGAYVPLGSFISQKKQTKTLRFPLRHCAFLRVKLRGVGFSKIFKITYYFEQGSEK